ncbi:MAG: DUF1254 domain-containing protein [Alphaproteobacteria bacterium]|nr:DUF1254 domain-containing protein [Alphaproteobacteria bacterium]
MSLTLILLGILAALALAYMVSWLIVWAAPYYCMHAVEKRWLPLFGGWNKLGHAGRPSPRRRTIVQPNPDVFNSTCCYDLSGGAIRFKGPLPEDYWSLSLFAQNSDNYFAVNDSEIDGRFFDIVVHREGQRPPEGALKGATHVVASPTTKGVMLVRMFVRDRGAGSKLKEAQDLMVCEPV